MRIEKVLPTVTTLTRDQRYFLACWFNMVHQHSLDTFRVRVMNPLACLREIVRIMALGNEAEKLAVLGEAHALIGSDPILRAPSLVGPAAQFLGQLSDKKALAKKDAEKPLSGVFGYFLQELKSALEKHYVAAAFDRLEQVLVRNEAVPAVETERFLELHHVCGNLLSTLLFQGFSLESLFQVYWQVLVPRRVKPNYSFERKLWLSRQILTQEAKPYRVALAIDQVSKPEELEATIGDVSFSSEPPFALQARHAKQNYLDRAPRRIFASMEATAFDPRSAGAAAFERANDIVNLLRFEYEHAHIQMPNEFAFVLKDEEANGARVYPIPMIVPNPPSAVDGVAATAFIRSVEELVSGAPFTHEGRDRIYSAFRLYRLGRDTNVIENKLLNWWTAVEYLTRGSQASGGIGASVESALAPTLSISYLPKLLAAIRNVLLEAGATLTDSSHQPIALRAQNHRELYKLFVDAGIQGQALAAVADHTYVAEQLRLLFSDLSPQKFANRLKLHDERVRWQIARVYRARCDIVHSAGRSANTALLCSNLEYYLKTALHALLRAVRDIPTLSGPREFFDRQAFLFDQIHKELTQGKDDGLQRSLDA